MKRLTTLLFSFAIALLGFMPLIVHSQDTNLIANPSVEQSANNLPTAWSSDKWGTNTATFSYGSTAHSGSHGLNVQMTKYTSGDAKWYFNPITVQANTSYNFSDWYQSNIKSSIDAVVILSNGQTDYLWQSDLTASSSWKQASFAFKTPTNAKSVTFYHYIEGVGSLTTDDYNLSLPGSTPAPTPTPPTVQLTAPTNSVALSGTQTITALAADAKAVASVQFKIDGTNLGAADTTAPYTTAWDTTKVANGTHTISAVATNSDNLSTTSTISVNINNIVLAPPTVQITAPANNATISGIQTLAASASDAKGVASVQFKIDGTNMGNPLTAIPYTIPWDTTKVANGTHTLSAIATNTSGLSTTATNVMVNIQNTIPAPIPSPPAAPNLIPNPSFEIAQDANTPQNWLASNWGTNTSVFSYLNSGHTGSRSVKVETTAYTDGAANWFYNDLPVASGKTYKYENWYQSNVDTEVDAEVQMNDGSLQYFWLGTVLANPSWSKFSTTFTVPAGAKSMAIYQILAKKGYIVSDDYSLSEYTSLPFNRGLVSVTFDDGWTNQYNNAFPLLKQYGLPATFYIISGELNDPPSYMSATQVKNLQVAGEEIGSHTITHPDLTTLSATQLQNEMANSQATLQATLGVPITDFAYPYGAYNAATIAVGKQYYQSQRTVNSGLNTKDSFNITQLKIYEVDSNISQAQVQGWVDAAIAQKSWLILVYHEIAITPSDRTNALYTTQPTDLNAELAYLKNSGVAVVTVNQAINEITPQL